jgi:alanine racemase
MLFAATVSKLGIPPYPVHLKIDTGMHRLGFQPGESGLLVEFLSNHPEIYIKSLFSHLAASEDPLQDYFSLEQINRFTRVSDNLSAGLGYPFIRHILNSAGIERFPQARFEMVRLGIGLYGFSSRLSEVKPIASLRTRISQIHDLPAGEAVGYGRLSILPGPSRIAVIPVGYADGIDRRLGNGNYSMLVRDLPAPTIGNICMDMTLLDVTGLEAVEGDEVEVFGPRNSAMVMASVLGTIPYEILTSIPERVKRVYLFD